VLVTGIWISLDGAGAGVVIDGTVAEALAFGDDL
jgi:hypothetical protein